MTQTPGPGAYEIVDPGHYSKRGPSFSIYSRVLPPRDFSKKPGPGAHSPEKVRGPRE